MGSSLIQLRGLCQAKLAGKTPQQQQIGTMAANGIQGGNAGEVLDLVSSDEEGEQEEDEAQEQGGEGGRGHGAGREKNNRCNFKALH